MRHGAPELTGRLLGHLDVPVTSAGAEACRARAAGLEIGRLWSSDLQRAQVSAQTLGTPGTDPRWRELDFGLWDGVAPADLDRQALSAFWADPEANAPPGGERWSELMQRVGSALKDLSPEPTLIVTHGGPMRAALCHLLEIDLQTAWRFDLPYAALLAFSVEAERPRRAQLTGLLA
nr:histidine phosphatase family protein [Sandaracinobacteroides sayramensis]